MKQILLLYLLICGTLLSHATNWVITNSGLKFVPSNLTITYGDTVSFQLDTLYNAQEVGYNTWLADDSLPVIGFNTPYGGGVVTGLALGSHYYVSDTSADLSMKGEITVVTPAVVHFTTTSGTVNESGSPVPVVIEVDNPGFDTASFIVQQDTFGATAEFNKDYTFIQQLIYSPPGTTFDTVYIVPIDDEIIGPAKTAKLFLNTFSANAVPGADSIFTLTILDNDTLFVSFLGAAFSYLKSADSAYVGITISSVVAGATSVTVILDSGNAVKGVDFECADTTIFNFPPDSIDTLYLPIKIFDDGMATGNLQINFRLIDPSNGAQLGISGYTVFLIDDDDTAAGVKPVDLRAEVHLFPNPASDLLNVQTSIDLMDMTAFDLYGRQVLYAGSIQQGTTKIDISQLPAGTYLLQGKTQEKAFVTRFNKM